MKKLSFPSFILVFILYCSNNLLAQNSDPVLAGKDIAVVTIESGKLRGYVHNGIFIYKGVPYAKAERFVAPVKIAPWAGVRTAFSYGAVCPIDPTTSTNDEFEFPFNHDLGFPNENCQSVNVWTKHIDVNHKRPVMVWIHGGGFTAGSSIELPSYDGEQLARKGDVVVVSMNHRLNVLGFLDLTAHGEKYKGSANAGMLDIQESLKWVKSNISQFGGDPNNVTIFGQSGGGAKVTTLMSAPSAKGLFNKAIVESGSYLSSFMEPSISKRISEVLLQQLNISTGNIDSLQRIPYDILNLAGHKALSIVQKELTDLKKTVPGFGLGWGPILDGYFLPSQLTDPATLDISKNIPLMIGSTKNEFNPFSPATRNISMEQAEKILKSRYSDKSQNFIKAVKKAYPNTSKPSDYTDIDLVFRPAGIRQANLHALAANGPVYMYLFAWQSPVNDGMYKAFHCMDIPFQFCNIERCEEMTGGGKQAKELAEKVSGAWINFATTGNPSTTGLPIWPKYTEAKGATMIFDNTSVIGYYHDAELLSIASEK